MRVINAVNGRYNILMLVPAHDAVTNFTANIFSSPIDLSLRAGSFGTYFINSPLLFECLRRRMNSHRKT